jgi:predicted AAA+ superfamily ATPase
VALVKDFFDKSEVLKILQGFNPWWTKKPFDVPPFQRVAYDVCRKLLLDSKLKRAILLCGPRRVGKTTILNQIADTLVNNGRDPRSVFYLSLDHPLLKLLTLTEILGIYHENIFPEGKACTLLLDEIHYSKEWELYVKQLVDHQPQYRILATGSATVSHLRKTSESGTGRWIKVPIPTLSFFEFAQITEPKACEKVWNEQITKLFSKKTGELSLLAEHFAHLMPLFRRYLVVGGFPETAILKDTAFCQRLLREDVVERVLKRDMTALFGVRNVNELEKLFIYLCLHSGGILSISACAKALETTSITIANHLELLADAYLIYRLPPMELTGKKVLKARHKVYLADAALRNAVLLRGEEILDDPKEMGEIVETTVLRHLFAYYYQETPTIAYWRDAKTEKEVDIVVQSPKTILPVEVKFRTDTSIGRDDGLSILCKTEKIPRAYVITQRQQDFEVSEMPDSKTKVLRIPAHIFTYLIGHGEHQQWDT